MKKMLTITVIIIAVIIGAVLISAGVFFYNNTHWWEKDLKRIKKAGAVERQVTLPSGNVINYGETAGNGPELLLIHGQMGAWEDYACVLPELAKKWHIYAVDLYGHGRRNVSLSFSCRRNIMSEKIIHIYIKL